MGSSVPMVTDYTIHKHKNNNKQGEGGGREGVLQYHNTYHSSVCCGGSSEGRGGHSNCSRRLLHRLLLEPTAASWEANWRERDYQLFVARGPDYHDVIMRGCVCEIEGEKATSVILLPF